jgi:hypothetical protein
MVKQKPKFRLFEAQLHTLSAGYFLVERKFEVIENELFYVNPTLTDFSIPQKFWDWVYSIFGSRSGTFLLWGLISDNLLIISM